MRFIPHSPFTGFPCTISENTVWDNFGKDILDWHCKNCGVLIEQWPKGNLAWSSQSGRVWHTEQYGGCSQVKPKLSLFDVLYQESDGNPVSMYYGFVEEEGRQSILKIIYDILSVDRDRKILGVWKLAH